MLQNMQKHVSEYAKNVQNTQKARLGTQSSIELPPAPAPGDAAGTRPGGRQDTPRSLRSIFGGLLIDF